ncbi:hypothetical protein GPECTOR_112g258 [Gonium pectorale]|uniref:Uncharacterized protein n=1 Tax=Gonium pectorale TaxID=33097 RepID=A0A150FZ77_GONPE|nr:hypothetical protein GPECTOR_112g258 [Gonium pectorale]|eukprot:KXZ42888.1 hypothetical protein GPECTOR_112g258 [Gonium pectorale]
MQAPFAQTVLYGTARRVYRARLEDRAYMYTVPDAASVCRVDDVGRLLGAPNLGPASVNYRCVGQMKMRSASLWLGIVGGLLMVLLMARGFRAAIMIAILFVTFVSWVPGHEASYLGASSQIEGGAERMAYFKKVVTKPDASFTALQLHFGAFGSSQLWVTLVSDLYLDLLDSTGTFFSMASYINKRLPGFVDPVNKTFPRMTLCYCADASAVCVAALLGIPPISTYVESATGIREGGRTGITAIVIGLYFGISMFLTPIISSIPPYATGPALILVGSLMMENLLDIEWQDYTHAMPAFITIAVIPMTYSIAYGILAGILSYLALYSILTVYDLATIPFTGKTLASVLAAAKPEWLKPYAQREADEIARNQQRMHALEAELSYMSGMAAERCTADPSNSGGAARSKSSLKLAALSFALSSLSRAPSASNRGSRVHPDASLHRAATQPLEVSVMPRHSRAVSGGGGGGAGGGGGGGGAGGGDSGEGSAPLVATAATASNGGGSGGDEDQAVRPTSPAWQTPRGSGGGGGSESPDAVGSPFLPTAPSGGSLLSARPSGVVLLSATLSSVPPTPSSGGGGGGVAMRTSTYGGGGSLPAAAPGGGSPLATAALPPAVW